MNRFIIEDANKDPKLFAYKLNSVYNYKHRKEC